MDYTTDGLRNYEGQNSVLGQVAATERDVDFNALRDGLNREVGRVNELADRINNLADDVFGPRPMDLSDGAKSPEPPMNLLSIAERLDNALSRAERAMSRLQ